MLSLLCFQGTLEKSDSVALGISGIRVKVIEIGEGRGRKNWVASLFVVLNWYWRFRVGTGRENSSSFLKYISG